MRCQKCNKVVPDNSLFCLHCGAKLIEGTSTPQKKKKASGRRPKGTGTIWTIKGRKAKPFAAQLYGIYLGTFATKIEAQLAIDKAVRDPEGTRLATVTVEQARDRWLEVHTKTVTDAALTQYSAAWNYLKPLAKMPLRNVKTDAFQRIIDEMVEQGKSRSTCEKVKQLASQICKWGEKNDVISKNYAEFLTLPKAEKSDKTPFSDDDLAKMWEIYDKEKDRRIGEILLMCYTGFRINEFLSLKKSDYRDGCLHGGSKTEKGRNRAVPVPSFCKDLLDDLMSTEHEYIVPTATGKAYDVKNYRTRRYKKALEEYNLPALTPHATRHTYATLSVKAGIDKKALQDILGHEKFETTANIYTHVNTEWLIEQASRLQKPQAQH